MVNLNHRSSQVEKLLRLINPHELRHLMLTSVANNCKMQCLIKHRFTLLLSRTKIRGQEVVFALRSYTRIQAPLISMFIHPVRPKRLLDGQIISIEGLALKGVYITLPSMASSSPI